MSRKVKNFFGKKEAVPVSFDKLKKESYNISFDVLKDLSSENSTSQRLKCIKDLNDIVLTKNLEKYAVEALCENVKDLLDSQNNSTETRHTAYQFFHALIVGQIDYLATIRSYLFKLLLVHANPEDTVPRLEMLRALTDCGKNISYFEEELGPFLLLWFPDILNTDKTADFLALVTNVIKFNAAYLDDEVISGFIEYISILCSRTKFEEDIEASLNVLEAILCYSHLPNYALQRFVCTLCLTVNIEKFSQCSWKQMRNLLGTNVGHTCVFSLCQILQERSNHNQSALLRGAIFYIGMALWGPNKVATLIHPPTAVLPSFLRALECNDNIIAYEVVLSLQRLVKSVEQLQSLSWEIIFNILENILEFPELQDGNESSLLAKAVHDLISMAENTVSESSQQRLFTIIEKCSSSRNEQSVMKLIAYSVEQMNPFRGDFLSCLVKILEKYFKNEKRVAIQLESLKVVSHVRQNYGHLFEEDLVDQTILQYLSQLDTVPDAQVRRAAVELLIDMGYSCYGILFVDVLDIIEKVMKLSFDTLSNLSDPVATRDQFVDVSMAVQGVIKIFKKKLFVMPSSHCLSIFSGVINYIKLSYSHLSYNNEILSIRKMIIEFLLEFRANNQKQVGIVIGNNEKYSVHITCDANLKTELSGSVPSSPAPCSPPAFGGPTISYFSYKEAFEVLVLSLKQEKDWTILDTIFQKLPRLLQNKSLIVQGNCSLPSLCSTLCSMVIDRSKSLPDSLKNTPPRLTRTEVQGHIYPCICTLTSYHAYLEPYIQRILIKCLQSGLVSRSAKLCIDGLMICCLEMQNSMMKLVPDVLLRLSKISSTVNVAVSILEFLSNLIRLPQLYLSFVEDQYMSIFAIALPYTNPFKFNQYIVALAHHVIAMWFLKCRIPFRKDFAKFISKGLSSNIRLPREESESSAHKNLEDSAQTSEDKSKKMSNSAIIALHTELMETGLDLMARFTFGMSSNVPKRSPVSEFLLEKGQKTSWLVGNKVITITTSGCNTKSVKNGLCERCFNICVEFNKNADSFEKDSIFPEEPMAKEPPPVPSFRFERKRHRSAIQRRSVTLSRDLMTGSTQTKDDILLHFRRLQSVDSALRDEDPREEFSFLKSEQDKKDEEGLLCSCWCTNWAEVHIRRPTGNTSWLMKLQNQLFLPSSSPDVPLSLLTSMVLQGPWGQGPDSSLLFPMAEELLESDQFDVPCSDAIDITSYPKTEPPMRRTNSSPDVNTLWLESTGSSDADPFRKPSLLQDSTDSDWDSRAGDAELEDSLRKINQEDKKSNLRLDLRTESKYSDQPLRGNEESFAAHRKGISMGPFRDRGHTISVMSPIHPKVSENASQTLEPNRRNGMNPSFVFLQLYHNSCFGQKINKPLLLPQHEANLRSLYILDHIPPYDTHKIGVVYVGEGQATDEVAILSNVYGSSRYVSFIRKLGNLVRLTDVDPRTTYLGGLDVRGEDGKFALIWHDDVMQVVFHIATLMVNKEKDPMRHEKKKHIANDSVMIVYNESGEDFSLSTIKGHVTNACVIISPKDSECNTVSVKLRTEELSEMFGHFETYMISDESLPVFVRQLALHANLASLIRSRQQQSMKDSHVSNWLERLRTIKRLRSKVLEEIKNANDNFEGFGGEANSYDSFTDYV